MKKLLTTITMLLTIFVMSCSTTPLFKDKNSINYLKLAEKALMMWGINRIGFSHVRKPGMKNWVTVASDKCEAHGVPEYVKNKCLLAFPNMGGLTATLHNKETGVIINSTVIISKNYLDMEYLSNEARQRIFTHEIGHAIGLKHSPLTKSVMFLGNDRSTGTKPLLEEKYAVNRVYTNNDYTSAFVKKHFDTVSTGVVKRQSEWPPMFWISLRAQNK